MIEKIETHTDGKKTIAEMSEVWMKRKLKSMSIPY